VSETVELYFLRHADAGDPVAWTGPDAARPLSPKGEKQSERLGRFLAGIGFRPDAIISSPKLRASQTAEIVAEQLGVPVTLDPRLGSGVDEAAVEAILGDAGDPRRAVLVGHDPDFTSLVQLLCEARNVEMKKAALARIDVDRPVERGRGELRWLVPPDLVKPASGRP
jgi:phosphohistidine phosphatase